MSVETTIEVVMPEMGESVTEGTILEWHRSEGDPINVDETIVEISTDKVDAEVPSPASGIVSKILVAEGETVNVGQVIAEITLGEGGEAPAKAPDAPVAETNGSGTAPAAASNGTSAPEGTIVSPVAKRAAADLGVDLGTVAGSGREGRIFKDDVLAAATGGGSAKSAGGSVSATQLKGGAATLAKYMDKSRSVPTATSFRNLPVGALDARRKQLKEAGLRVSFTHIIAWAIAVAATEDMPVMANHFEDRDGKPFNIDDGQVNLGLAVDVEKKDGTRTLMVPVIRDAGRLDFAAFLAAYDALVDKARENKLTADDLVGGNVSLTNPGGLGTVASVPRLMEGQGTIIAAGAIGYPAGLADAAAALGAEKSMTLTSTYDHRIIQGAESGRFLGTVDSLLQGEQGFYERLFGDLGVQLPALPQKPAPTLPSAAPALGTRAGEDPSVDLLQAVQAATSLVKAHRTHGHLAAHLDPLGAAPPGDPALDPGPLSLTDELMGRIPAKILRMFVPGKTLAEALPHLRAVYCGTTGYESEHLASHEQRMWWREQVEAGTFRKPLTQDESVALLNRLTEVDALERFMHKAYLGQKQFSIEGLDMTVPMLDELVQLGAAEGAHEVVIGMAHRGRLNVLAHNLGRSYESIFAEFEGVSTLEAITTIPQGGTGDVKYHHGSRGRRPLPDGGSVIVRLESNPSHLEFVTPVIEGAARAAQTHHDGPLPDRDLNRAMPVAIHGDAAFPGQGVVAETLNLQLLEGYTVGGTVHLIQNNQIGFTTNPNDSRSTRWASDIAKGFDVPVIHVNADDVEACVHAVRLAFAFRQKFRHDVVIDLIGYRRFGHNEADEPLYTQPDMYAVIKDHLPVREIYAAELVERGVLTKSEADLQTEKVWQRLTDDHQALKSAIENHSTPEQQTGEYQLDRTQSPNIETAVSAKTLQKVAKQLFTVPDGFTINKKLEKQLAKRVEEIQPGGGVTWANAEALAFATLLMEGSPIRFTGQDTERGTFSQRHMVLHDANDGHPYTPIANLPNAKAPIEVHNSPLSEAAALAFEYGYSQEAPQALVLWEAQFGDFVNGAQVIVDQFIASGMSKWGQTTRLTLMLPHGYEGSGPEHSSARLERFLQLAAEGNMRITNPTTPAQWFHLLRRQAKIAKLRPLIVMTPKSLLRLAQATSDPAEFSEGAFQPVLADPFIKDDSQVTRLILCSGKVYYDLAASTLREAATETAIGRVELLYPFPQQSLLALVARYPNLREVVWVQEEPRNMGARAHMSPRLLHILPNEISFGYIGRPERASPGEGYPAAHADEQNRIIRTALDQSVPVTMYPAKLPGER